MKAWYVAHRALWFMLLGMAFGLVAGDSKKKCPFKVNPKSATVCMAASQKFNALKGNTGQDLQLVAVSQPKNGGVVVANFTCNTFTYTAPTTASTTCTDCFTYTLEDGCGRKKTAKVTISIVCCEKFVVNDKSGITQTFESITFNALEGNSGCDLALVSVTQPINGGTVTLDLANNTFTYTAPSDPSVTQDSFTYTLSATCPKFAEKTAQVFITIIPCTAPLEVNPKSAVVCPDTPVSFDALQGNSGCGLTLVSVTQPAHGTVALSGNSFTYTSFPNVPDGTLDSFTYTMSGSGATATSTVMIRVTTQQFVINPLSAIMCPDSSMTFDALAPNNGCGSFLVSVTQPEIGYVTVNATANTFTYFSPPGLADGTIITFTYTVQSGTEQMTAPVTILMSTPPFVVNPLTIQACPLETIDIDITQQDSGCNLRIVATSPPELGTVTFFDTTLVYTAPSQGTTDSFTYTVTSTSPATDAVAATERTLTNTVTVTILDIPFVTVPLTASVAPGDTFIFQPLLYCSTCNAHLVSVTQPPVGEGSVTPDFNEVTFLYSAPQDIPVGTLVTFTYTLGEEQEQQTNTVTVRIVENPFIVEPVNGQVCPGGMVTLVPLETGSGGNRTVVKILTQPSQGTATLNPDGTITYRAFADASGSDSFEFLVALTRDLSITAVGTATITLLGEPLTAPPLTATMAPGETSIFAPLDVGTGCNRSLLSVAPFPDNEATVTWPLPNNTFSVTTSPNLTPGQIIMSSYTVIDIFGMTQTGTITITIEGIPLVVPDISVATCPGGSLLVEPLLVGSGVDRTLVAIAVPAAYQSWVVPHFTEGTITIIPPLDALVPTTFSFTYTVQDAFGTQGTGTISVMVDNVPFVVAPLSGSVLPGGMLVFDPLSVGSGCNRSLVSVTQPPMGEGTITPNFSNNTFTYNAPSIIQGGTVITVTYTLVDAAGDLVSSTVTITILPVQPVCDQVIVDDPFLVFYAQIYFGTSN